MVPIPFLSQPRGEVLTVRFSDNDTHLPCVSTDFFTNFRNNAIDLSLQNSGMKNPGRSVSRPGCAGTLKVTRG